MHRRVEFRQRGEALLYHPVDLRLRVMAHDVADYRQVVQHITQRGGFDQQDARRLGIGVVMRHKDRAARKLERRIL